MNSSGYTTHDWQPDPAEQLEKLQAWLWEQQELGASLEPAALRQAARIRFPALPAAALDEALREFLEYARIELDLRANSQRASEILPLRSFGNYELGPNSGSQEVHRGGLASVHKAFDTRFARVVAIKVPLKPFKSDPEVCSRLRREAHLCARLQHPNIVPIYDLGTHEAEQCPFFVMKYVEGKNLLQYLAAHPETVDRLRHLRVVRDVVDTLEHAHARGIIHRDVKPENVMVGEFGEVHLLDWGLARDLRDAEQPMSARQRALDRYSQTAVGQVFGTFAYMSPEQALGLVAEHSPKTDVFGVGGILCHVLTGQPLYRGTRQQVMADARKCRTDDALLRLRQSGAPESLQALVRDCLQPRPEQRPAAAEVRQRLDAYLEGLEQAAVRAERRARTATSILAVAAIVAVLLLAGMVVLRTYYRTQTSELAELTTVEARTAARLDDLDAARQRALDQLLELEPSEDVGTRAELGRLAQRLDAIASEVEPAAAFPNLVARLDEMRRQMALDQQFAEREQERRAAEAARVARGDRLLQDLRLVLDDGAGLLVQHLLEGVPLDFAAPWGDLRRQEAFLRCGIDWNTDSADQIAVTLGELDSPDTTDDSGKRGELLVHLQLWYSLLQPEQRESLGTKLRQVTELLDIENWLPNVEALAAGSPEERHQRVAELLASTDISARYAVLLLAIMLADRGAADESHAILRPLVAQEASDELVAGLAGTFLAGTCRLGNRTSGRSDANAGQALQASLPSLQTWRTLRPQAGAVLAAVNLIQGRARECLVVCASARAAGSDNPLLPALQAAASADLQQEDSSLKFLSQLQDSSNHKDLETFCRVGVLVRLERYDQALAAAGLLDRATDMPSGDGGQPASESPVQGTLNIHEATPLLRGVIHARREDWPRAETEFRELLRTRPACSAARAWLARTLLVQGRDAESASLATELAGRGMGPFLAGLRVDRAYGQGDWQACLLALFEDWPGQQYARGTVRTVVAALLEQEEYRLADRVCRQWLAGDPADTEFQALRARALAGLGQYAIALDIARRALARDPSQPDAHQALLGALKATAGLEVACEEARRYCRVFPDRSSAHALLCDLLLEAGAVEEARGVAIAWNQRFPRLAGPKLRLGQIAVRQDDLATAEAVLREAIELDLPECLEAGGLLTQLLLTSGRLDDARQVVDNLLGKYPAHPASCRVRDVFVSFFNP